MSDRPVVVSADVGAAESLFPLFEDLGLRAYWRYAGNGAPECEYLEYHRGAFISTPDAPVCQVIDPDNRPTLAAPVPAAFDLQANRDLDLVKTAFAATHLDITYLHVVFLGDHVAAGTVYSTDACAFLTYEPGWTALPPDVESVSRGINTDWYVTDYCYR